MTHQRILAKRCFPKPDLRDIFGWNVGFELREIDAELAKLLQESSALENFGSHVKSRIRIASLNDHLFLHSSFPTVEGNAVFFGPDSYRFARFVETGLGWMETSYKSSEMAGSRRQRPLRILDIGCGTGVGGIVAAKRIARFSPYELTMTDINPLAVEFARVNARFAEVPATFALGDTFSGVTGEFDVVVANPPYICDDAKRAYRHGGGLLGLDLSLRICEEALPHLAVGGSLILYTGVAMIDDSDPLKDALQALLRNGDYDLHHEEIDSDVFGEELERTVYEKAERIAAVGVCITRRGHNHYAA